METKPILTVDECIKKIKDYLGDFLSEGTPPDPPDLETCWAIDKVIEAYNYMMYLYDREHSVEPKHMDGSNWLNCSCREAVGAGTVQCKECGRYKHNKKPVKRKHLTLVLGNTKECSNGKLG